MIRFNRFALAIFVWLLLAGVTTGPALAVDSATLIKHSDRFDGRTVTFEGEVIGDVMVRQEGVWLNINDDPYSRQGQKFQLAGYNKGQSVIAPAGTENTVKIAGRYSQRGDIVRVSGVFRQASAKYGGDMLIEATSVELVKRGFPLHHPIAQRELLVAIVCLAMAAFILGLSRVLGLRLV